VDHPEGDRLPAARSTDCLVLLQHARLHGQEDARSVVMETTREAARTLACTSGFSHQFPRSLPAETEAAAAAAAEYGVTV